MLHVVDDPVRIDIRVLKVSENFNIRVLTIGVAGYKIELIAVADDVLVSVSELESRCIGQATC